MLILVDIVLDVEHIVIFNTVFQDLYSRISNVRLLMTRSIIIDKILYIFGEGCNYFGVSFWLGSVLVEAKDIVDVLDEGRDWDGFDG